jgi:hypothetical protein
MKNVWSERSWPGKIGRRMSGSVEGCCRVDAVIVEAEYFEQERLAATAKVARVDADHFEQERLVFEVEAAIDEAGLRSRETCRAGRDQSQG